MKKSIQYFSDEYLNECQKMSPTQIAQFLEDYRQIAGAKLTKSVMISLRVPENILEGLKLKANLEGSKYQTKIIELIKEYLTK